MDTFLNGKKVLLSGSIVAVDEEPVRFELSPSFRVVFRFRHDDSVKDRHRNAEIENGELIFTFINYDEQSSISNRDTLTIGTLNGREVLMNFAFSYIGNLEHHSRVIFYTFLEGAVREGGAR